LDCPIIETMDTCITDPLATLTTEQDARNRALLAQATYCGPRFASRGLPLTLDLAGGDLRPEDDLALAALEKTAARTAIESPAALAKHHHDIDQPRGRLEVIPSPL